MIQWPGLVENQFKTSSFALSVKSFREISAKKILLTQDQNELDPNIDRTLEIAYGLRNFIGNATKYSNSIVEINLKSNDTITEVKVSDDGPGFSEDVKDLINKCL